MTPHLAIAEPISDAPTEGRRRPIGETRRAVIAALLGVALAIAAPADDPPPPPAAPKPRPDQGGYAPRED